MDDNIKFQISKKWLINAGIQFILIILACITGFAIGYARGPKWGNPAGSDSGKGSFQSELSYVSKATSGLGSGLDKASWSGADASARQAETSSGQYIASKTGKKYYPVGCKSADRIKPENIVSFESADQAERAGYSASTQC